MRMPAHAVFLPLLLVLPPVASAGDSTPPAVTDCPQAQALPADADAESRRFACAFPLEFQQDVALAQLMGHSLWVADQAAWVSSDALKDAGALARMEGRVGAGWLTASTSDTENRWRVAYLVRQGDTDAVWADVDVWFKGGPPDTQVHVHDTPRPLTEFEQAQERAKSLALGQEMLACATHYNVAVLPLGEDDVDVLHVYVMPAQAKANAYPMGGFHDFRVSGDGRRVLGHFAQTRACLDQEFPEDGEPAALVVSHLNSPTPTAFHVFFSLTYGKPVYVSTSNGRLWLVGKGRVSLVESPAAGSMAAKVEDAMKPDAASTPQAPATDANEAHP
jgi:hypothetical protein